MIALLLGLAAMASVLFCLSGVRALRGDPLAQLPVADLLVAGTGERRPRGAVLDTLAGRLTPSVQRALGPAWTARLQRQIDLAGRPEGLTVDALLGRFVRWALLVSPAALLFLVRANVVGLVVVVVVVTIMPLARLARARRLRRERIERDLPDFLDILAVTVTAGAALEWALGRVAECYSGPLADEIRITLDQLATGASRRLAFENLRRRTDSEAVAEFVTAFLQSQELGAPLAETLNLIAADMRRASAQRMRHRAARAAPRVTLVTSMVLVPGALILVSVGLLLGSSIDFGSLFRGVQ
ncbi:MAG TPA: type II secretion system F family protein [Acidimicrobiales bacterium]|nr:type II secretion system F family protein [Acidimicrobiales bacterium]